jgi:hypothetical protein
VAAVGPQSVLDEFSLWGKKKTIELGIYFITFSYKKTKGVLI